MRQTDRTLQEALTSLAPAEVLARAKRFFSRRPGIYSAFVEREGPGFITLRGQGGEEIALGAIASGKGSTVTGSSYMFDQQIARFLATLPPGDVASSASPGQPTGALT